MGVKNAKDFVQLIAQNVLKDILYIKFIKDSDSVLPIIQCIIIVIIKQKHFLCSMILDHLLSAKVAICNA